MNDNQEQREKIAMENIEKADELALGAKSVADLKMRLGLLNKIIREAQAKKDPRWREAARQQRVVNKALVKKIKEARHQRGEPEPEPVRIGMKSVRMRGRAITGSR